MQARADARRGVDEAPVVVLPDTLDQLAESFDVHLLRGRVGRGRQQVQAGNVRVLGHLVQGCRIGHGIGKRHHRPVIHTQGDIQIAQAHVAVDAKHPAALRRKTRCDPRAQRRFPGAALAGRHRHDLPQSRYLHSVHIISIITGFWYFSTCFLRNITRSSGNGRNRSGFSGAAGIENRRYFSFAHAP
jgi:hypothetical protein